VGADPEQYGYRPGRSGLDAVREVHTLIHTGHREVVDADLSGYFDSIPHAELLKTVTRRISDRHLLSLIKQWLQARRLLQHGVSLWRIPLFAPGQEPG
jgi:RNA-directed DNA polymerase